jgi:uncharacterized repeat protein (TIGR01451 family)
MEGMTSTPTPDGRLRRRGPGGSGRPRRLRRILTTIGGGLVLGAAVVVPLDTADTADAAELGFPFRTDFATAAGGTLTGNADIVDGWLRLTKGYSEAGAWQMNDAFPSDLGLEIEFRYATWGGDGADGFALSLTDGAAPAGVGRPGAALGYACHTAAGVDGPCDLPGIPGGYAGIGFDEYGNFSSAINDSGPGRAPDTVAIRGSGSGTDGYRFLRNVPAPDGIATGSRQLSRVVRVTIQPNASGRLGLSVRSTAGMSPEFRTLLDDVPLDGPGQADLPPTLRLGFSASTGRHQNVHEIDELSVRIPADLAVEQSAIAATAGERVTYTVTSSNPGRNPSHPSDLVVDLPDTLQDVTWTCSAGAGGTCGDASGSAVDGALRTTVGLDRGGSVTHEITGTLAPDATGALESVATIRPEASMGDTDETNNVSRVRADIAARAELSTGKSVALLDGSDTLHPGDDVEYTVVARNGGPSVARAVGARDDLPAELTFATSDNDCSAVGQRVTCTSDADLAPGAEHAFRFRATLDPDYRGDGSDVTNIAVATSPTDPDDGDPSDEVVLPPVTGPGDDGGDDGSGGGGDSGGAGPGDGTGSADGGSSAGGAGHGTGTPTRGNGSGALAFTGTRGLGLLAGAGTTAALLGLLIRRFGRQMNRAASIGLRGD